MMPRAISLLALSFSAATVYAADVQTTAQNPIQQIQYVGAVACKAIACSPKTASLVGVAVFHQECGARANCNGHAPAYRGSFALSEEQFNRGIASYLPMAQQSDPVLYEILQAEIRRTGSGGAGRDSHILSAAAWFGNNARFLSPIERVTSDPYRQAAIGMLLQLMPTQTHRALLSADPASLLNTQLSCSGNGAIWALNKNKVPVSCGSTASHAIDLMVQGYPSLRRGVAVALGTTPPVPGSLTSSFVSNGFGPVATNLFTQGGTLNPNVLNGFAAQPPGSWDTAQPGTWSNGSQGTAQQQSSSPYQQQPYQYPTYPYTNATSQQLPISSGQVQDVSADGSVAEAEVHATIECTQTSVRWTCTNSSSSRGLSSPRDAVFSTRGYLTGSSRIDPVRSTTYTVQCIRMQSIVDQASCDVTPRRHEKGTGGGSSELSLVLDPDVVHRGDTTHIEWSALKVDSCELRARGLKEEGVEGSIDTPPLALAGRHTFTLSCLSNAGERLVKQATLTVE